MNTFNSLKTKLRNSLSLAMMFLLINSNTATAQNDYIYLNANTQSEELVQSVDCFIAADVTSASNVSVSNSNPTVEASASGSNNNTGNCESLSVPVATPETQAYISRSERRRYDYANTIKAAGNVTLQSNKAIQTVKVLDVRGNLVFAKNVAATEGQSKFSVNLAMPNVPAGIYIAQVSDADGNTSNIKLIKMN